MRPAADVVRPDPQPPSPISPYIRHAQRVHCASRAEVHNRWAVRDLLGTENLGLARWLLSTTRAERIVTAAHSGRPVPPELTAEASCTGRSVVSTAECRLRFWRFATWATIFASTPLRSSSPLHIPATCCINDPDVIPLAGTGPSPAARGARFAVEAATTSTTPPDIGGTPTSPAGGMDTPRPMAAGPTKRSPSRSW